MKNQYMKTQTVFVFIAGLLIFLFSFLHAPFFSYLASSAVQASETREIPAKGMVTMVAVSYTHLTLPTKRIV